MARIAGGTDTGLSGDEWIQQDEWRPPKKSYLENIEEGSLWPDKGELIDVSIAGSSGYGSNYRHAGNVALLKNIISNKIATDTGFSLIDKPTRAIGDVLGGITGWGAGLKHELTAESPIFNENLTNGIFTTDFLEDMAANYYGAIHGKTGITSANVVNEMAKALATGEDSNLEYLNKMGLKQHLEGVRENINVPSPFIMSQGAGWDIPGRTWPINQKEFRKIFMDKYHKSPSEINRERLEKERFRKEVKRFREQSRVNLKKEMKGMPENLSFDAGATGPLVGAQMRGGLQQSHPQPTAVHHPHGNGGQNGSMPTGTAGRNPWGRAHGGLIDIPLSGRRRDI